MKLPIAFKKIIISKIIILILSLSSYATTYTVTTTADAGVGSLRTAITLANGIIGPDIIDFSTLPAGVQTITLLSALPTVTDQLTIDGYTSISYSANNPKIEIQCATGVVLDFSGASANGSVVRGLIINNSSQYGIRLNGTSTMIIAGCWIGLSNTGAIPVAGNELQQSGIQLINNSKNNIVGGTNKADRNVIGASKNNGIEIVNTSTGNTILGNYIGIGINGLTNVGNSSTGIYINGCSNNIIGGSSISCRNVISGNNSYGIDIENNATGILIKANFVGIASDGITVVQNGSHGIFLNNLIGAGTEIIGGTTFAERNVVSGNSTTTHGAGNGISLNNCSNITIKGNWSGVDSTGLLAVPNYWGGLSFTQCTNCTIGGLNQYEKNILSGNTNEGFYIGSGGSNTIIGNYIGVGSDGVTAIGNQKFGLNIQSGCNNNIIGGTTVAARNIISANGGPGIYMNSSDGNSIQGNYIGIAFNGITSIGNATSGIIMDNGCNNNSIGGLVVGATNSIAYNGVNGITILDVASFNNSINKNSIYCNVRRGIELNGLGNNSFPKPIILASSTTIILNGTAPANSYIEIFTVGPVSCKTCGTSGSSNDSIQGRVYIATVQANALGNWTYNNVSAFTDAVTATASSNNTGSYNTSEFSKCISCIAAAAPISVSISSGRDICSTFPGNITLTANGGTVADQVEWYTGSCMGTLVNSGNPYVISVPSVGVNNYYIRRISVCGNSACIKDSITVHAAPVAPISGFNPAFCSGTTGNTNLTVTGGSGEKLVWYTGSCGAGASIGIGSPFSRTIPSSSITYYARWESITCSSSNCTQSTITINQLPTPAIIGNSSVCKDSIKMFSTVATGNSFNWSFSSLGTGSVTSGQGTNSVGINVGTLSGTLSLTETTLASCSTIVSLPITIPSPLGIAAQAGADKDICNSTIQLAANNTSGIWTVYNGAGIFSPNGNAYNASVSGLSNGLNKFIWSTTGSCGFSSSDTLVVNMGVSGLLANVVASSDTICFGSPKAIQVNTSGSGSGNYNYVWSSSDNSFNLSTSTSIITVHPENMNTKYYLKVLDNINNGCSSEDTLLVHALPDQELMIPNLITPNGDDRNDYLEIRDKNDEKILPGTLIEIANRWGEKVYQNSNYDNTWNANDLSDGVYYYYIKSGCGNKVSKGWVQILR